MQITPAPLDGMLIIAPSVFEDERGYFLETHHYQRFQSANSAFNPPISIAPLFRTTSRFQKKTS
jgi:dTDP-4-dehydrorhamnose 3,5-epimerase-like enzyme